MGARSVTHKAAATFAFIGTVLAAALFIWDFVFDFVSAVRGLIPAARLVPALIYAIAAVSLAVFFYAYRTDRH